MKIEIFKKKCRDLLNPILEDRQPEEKIQVEEYYQPLAITGEPEEDA